MAVFDCPIGLHFPGDLPMTVFHDSVGLDLAGYLAVAVFHHFVEIIITREDRIGV